MKKKNFHTKVYETVKYIFEYEYGIPCHLSWENEVLHVKLNVNINAEPLAIKKKIYRHVDSQIYHDVSFEIDIHINVDTSVIPYGNFCYSNDKNHTFCPYWEQTDFGMVRCLYNGLLDVDFGREDEAMLYCKCHEEELDSKYVTSHSLFFDQFKCCNINLDYLV